MENQLTGIHLSNCPDLKYLYCDSIQLTGIDVSSNKDLYHLDLTYMPSLQEVCVWETPFPPEGLYLDTTGSPNVYFTTECGR